MFAAEFRDRIVHHLYYNYTHELYERTFIHDTYSCIKGRGTVGRMLSKLRLLAESDRSRWSASLNSFCGVLSHGANYRLRRRLMIAVPAFTKYGVFDMEYRRFFSF